MRLFNRNNRKNGSLQQQTAVNQKPLVPVICRYPHRIDENGDIPTRIRFVKSTAEPDHRYVNFFAWVIHIYLMTGSAFLAFIMKGGRDAAH
ncbi:hypothetical protein [Pedobacter nototheniae]|uniref:hypothetical protein n=1 Tax=Pedobacter nototheniae TaxID=2488994 RepID=UPI0010407D13|nr:hypothetical protein [Pedobacter nototheniae]